jgi:competence protein ComEA
MLRVPGIGPSRLEAMAAHLSLPDGADAEDRGRNGRSGDRVDLNRADRASLERLPGIGPALAGRILELRGREGPFRAVEDLLEVSGIGPVTLERLEGRVVVR